MTEEKAFHCIVKCLQKALNKTVVITPETDLLEADILDSLDGMVFMLELEQATGKKIPEEIDLVKEQFYTVPKLLAFLAA
jgi:acyl carrier protein